MSVYKRKYRSGKVVWFYQFALPGSTREKQNLVTGSGFATKQEAVEAETTRLGEERARHAAMGGVAAPAPTTLSMLVAEFMKQHAEENLAPKTVERYREMATYLAPELLAMDLGEIRPLHLSREWTRLLKSGGRDRKTKAPKAMKPKTVRNIAGLVSSAFARAIKWGLVSANPVTHSDLPKVRKRIGIALLPSEQDRFTEVATGPWCLSAFLEVTASSGARRGEVLALRWADLHGSTIVIDRSLCQTNEGLIFKGTKNEEPRKIELPPSTVACLEAHRLRQDQFRHQFGSDYQKDLDLIFTNPDGSPLMPNSISSTVSRLCRRLGLPKGASLHVLRHSHASLLLASGVDLATVSARLGHSSVRTTADIYSHAIRGKDRAAAQSWDDIMRKARAETGQRKSMN